MINVKNKDEGKRLDKFLLEVITALSRSALQKKIKAGSISVNGRSVTAHYFLKEGDEVSISDLGSLENSTDAPATERKGKKFEVEIIDETEDFIVINKPAGLIVHAAPSTKGKCLVDYLLEKYPEIAKVGLDTDRPGIVHRLDKDVSGLMVIARSQNGYDHLSRQFKERKTQKKYIALAYGTVEKDEDIIDFPLERSSKGYRMAARAKNQPGKTAITEFKVLKRFLHYCLLEISIKTGRTHQIRAHFSAYNHPLIGDDLYGTSKTKQKNKTLELGRVFLVATELGFDDLNGERKNYKIEIPEELQDLLRRIK